MANQEDRDLVVAYLHYSGSQKDTLSDEDLWGAYCQGDGFGFLPPEELSQINDGWDWSHVRDSTDEGWARMASYIRERGYGIDGPIAGPKP